MGKGLSKANTRFCLTGKSTKFLDEPDALDSLLDCSLVLERVEIKKSTMSEIPISIAAALRLNTQLQNSLTCLDLSQNMLTGLHDPLFTLVNLETLILKGNALTFVPDALTNNLFQLKKLDVSRNKISLLPWSWDGMVSLKTLNLSQNEIAFLPHSMFNLLLTVEEFQWQGNLLDSSYDDLSLETIWDTIRTCATPPEYQVKEKAYYEYHKSAAELLNQSPDIKYFRKFLHSEAGTLSLLSFMKAEFSDENLLFILAVLKFKATYPARDNPVRSNMLFMEAVKIYDNFVPACAPRMVNLPAEVSEELESIFSSTRSKINQWVFDRALETTIVGTGSDPFRRYLRTDAGSAWMPPKKIPKAPFLRRMTGISVPEWIINGNWLELVTEPVITPPTTTNQKVVKKVSLRWMGEGRSSSKSSLGPKNSVGGLGGVVRGFGGSSTSEEASKGESGKSSIGSDGHHEEALIKRSKSLPGVRLIEDAIYITERSESVQKEGVEVPNVLPTLPPVPAADGPPASLVSAASVGSLAPSGSTMSSGGLVSSASRGSLSPTGPSTAASPTWRRAGGVGGNGVGCGVVGAEVLRSSGNYPRVEGTRGRNSVIVSDREEGSSPPDGADTDPPPRPTALPRTFSRGSANRMARDFEKYKEGEEKL